MKIMQTLDGGLRLTLENPLDWMLLQAIPADAVADKSSLGLRLSSLIQDADVVEDWRDYIRPDLDESFSRELKYVASAVSQAHQKHTHNPGQPSEIWISKPDGYKWYSALNQARLALEEVHAFGQTEDLDASALSEHAGAAFARSRFYCALQGVLLDNGL